jgi:hypothetical protein
MEFFLPFSNFPNETKADNTFGIKIAYLIRTPVMFALIISYFNQTSLSLIKGQFDKSDIFDERG